MLSQLPTQTTAKRFLTSGGLRIAPYQAIEYAGWGKTKQLAWDRAYDKDGELCYICYYDAGNSVYAGFMKSILTPEDRRELYNSVADPREELLGDTLELALGILTLAQDYRVASSTGADLRVPTPVCGASKDRYGAMPLQRPLN